MVNSNLETTIDLIERIRQGDADARSRLIRRYLPVLTRWAHGRLPHAVRDLNETTDLVQTALMRAFSSVATFEPKGAGAFFAYLRQVMTNIMRDEFRRFAQRPMSVEVPLDLVSDAPSPLEIAVDSDAVRAYEQALDQLDEEQRELVIMRIELGLSYAEIAATVRGSTENAVRMRITRAVARLARTMQEVT